jgi:molecular chaperone HscA
VPWAHPAGTPTAPAPGRSRTPRRRRRLRLAVLVSLAVLLVASLTWGGAKLIRSLGGSDQGRLGSGAGGGGAGGGGASRGGASGGSLTPVTGFPLALDGVAATAVGPAVAYYAVVTGGHTQVRAVPLRGGTGWTSTVPIEPAELTLSTVGDLLILDGSKSNTDGGEDVRAVADAGTGRYLWKARWSQTDWDDLAYIGTDVIVARHSDVVTQRVNLRTGKARWTHRAPSGVIIAYHHAKAVLGWSPATGSSAAPVPRAGGAFQESIAADATRVVQLYESSGSAEVLNAATGGRLVSGRVGLADDLIADTWTSYDGLLVGAAKQGAPALIGYRLADLRQAWRYPLPAGADVRRVKACGQHRVCVSSRVTGGYQVMAVETSTGRAAWAQPLRSDSGTEPGWYLLGQRLLYGYGAFVSLGDHDLPAGLLDDKGAVTRLGTGDFTSVNAGAGGYGVAVRPQLSGSDSNWAVALDDLSTGKQTTWLDVGRAVSQPAISITGTTVAVINSGRLYLAQAPGLAAR